MRSLFIFALFFHFTLSLSGQLASTYFPPTTGFKWINRITPLDTLQQPIDSLITYRVDTFAVIKNYEGKNSNVVLSKSGNRSDIITSAYLDTTYFSFSGSDSYRYFNSLANIYKGGALDSLGIGSFLTSLKGWYDYLKFGQSVNQNYTIITKDTVINYNGTEYPVRFEITGKRLADANLTTEIGNFTCKKFYIKTSLGIKVLQFLIIPIMTINDTVWAAPNNWIVKDIIPSSKIDLSYISMSSVYTTGIRTEIIPSIPQPTGYTISGKVTYKNSVNTPLPSTKIFLHKEGTVKIDSTVSTADGSYSFNNVPNGNYTLTVLPSIPWGGVNSTDALIIRKYLISEYTLDSLQMRAADINGNSSINSTDALLIRRRLAGIDAGFNAGDWVFANTATTVNNANIILNIAVLCVGDVNISYVPVIKR